MLGIGALRPGWDPYQGRYFNPGIAVAMPLLILLADRKALSQIYLFLLSLLAIIVVVCSVVMNESKPLITQRSVARLCTAQYLNSFPIVTVRVCRYGYELFPFLLERSDIESLNYLEKETYSSSNQYAILNRLSQDVPANARIGLSLLNGDWEFPFFGTHFEYQLVPITNPQLLQNDVWLNQNGIDTLIVHQNEPATISVDPAFTLQDQIVDTQYNSIWQIYKR